MIEDNLRVFSEIISQREGSLLEGIILVVISWKYSNF